MEMDYLKNATAMLSQEHYVIAKSKAPVHGAFANIIAKDEVTVIIDEQKASKDFLAADVGWRLISLNVETPLDAIGIKARIAGALAQAGVAIMPIAAYSRDHFLIKERDLAAAKTALARIGISLKS